MEYSWEEWEKYGAYWRLIIGRAEKAARLFVKKLGIDAEIDTFDWDTPDLTVEFPSPVDNTVRTSIRFLLTGKPGACTLQPSCFAWRDIPTRPNTEEATRQWAHSSDDFDSRMSIPIRGGTAQDLQEIEGAAFRALEMAYDTVSRWRLADGKWVGPDAVGQEPVPVP